ncbi:MAG TPA: threonine synthase [Gemmatimonadaceae bacterium]|nr:threonine synthase [Gemmatimonadaceae bacterium]
MTALDFLGFRRARGARTWSLRCSAGDFAQSGDQLATVCPKCGQPLLVEYQGPEPSMKDLLPRWDMWRYAPLLPLLPDEQPVSLGEGTTPLIDAPRLATQYGVGRVWVKDEGLNPTGSFKARGMSAAVTRAKAFGVKGLVVPTAGNAGAAMAAYAAQARIPARVYAPRTTPPAILNTIYALGADLQLVDGHIGDAGKQARAFAADSGYFDVSTLREPYRIEGKKTMGAELAEQLGWRLPTHIIYPTGGGTGLIGMWKVFRELVTLGWLPQQTTMPKMIVAQANGCAPIVKAVAEGADHAEPWINPVTHAAGLRVPSPLGDRLIIKAVKESGGTAVSRTEEQIRDATALLARETGVDAAPEGGCALAVLAQLAEHQQLGPDAEVLVFNTGSGASYRT